MAEDTVSILQESSFTGSYPCRFQKFTSGKIPADTSNPLVLRFAGSNHPKKLLCFLDKYGFNTSLLFELERKEGSVEAGNKMTKPFILTCREI